MSEQDNNGIIDGMDDFISKVIGVCEDQFPKSCSNCGVRFKNFCDYVNNTDPIGQAPVAVCEKIADPVELISLVNCKCGGTISLKCTHEGTEMHKQFMEKVKISAVINRMTVYEILGAVRDVVRTRVQSRCI